MSFVMSGMELTVWYPEYPPETMILVVAKTRVDLSRCGDEATKKW
jgi:hypothetical protein